MGTPWRLAISATPVSMRVWNPKITPEDGAARLTSFSVMVPTARINDLEGDFVRVDLSEGLDDGFDGALGIGFHDDA
jgi:hypothetical protein